MLTRILIGMFTMAGIGAAVQFLRSALDTGQPPWDWQLVAIMAAIGGLGGFFDQRRKPSKRS
jgi:hypothetical protein